MDQTKVVTCTGITKILLATKQLYWKPQFTCRCRSCVIDFPNLHYLKNVTRPLRLNCHRWQSTLNGQLLIWFMVIAVLKSIEWIFERTNCVLGVGATDGCYNANRNFRKIEEIQPPPSPSIMSINGSIFQEKAQLSTVTRSVRWWR